MLKCNNLIEGIKFIIPLLINILRFPSGINSNLDKIPFHPFLRH